MTKPSVVNLDSYRLAEYAVQVPCYVCGGGNSFDAELCRHCFAPMALAHQASSQKIQPRMVACIGSSGVGKTVYLGMLMDMLSRQPEGIQLLARGAFSITLQQATIAALARCEFPEKTPSEPDRWNWVHCQVRAPESRHRLELIMPDMAGDAILEEVHHPKSFQIVSLFLSKCAGVMVLIDALSLQDGTLEQDFFTMKLLSYLTELDHDPKQTWRNKPVALIFSKSDQCEECFDDPAAYAQRHTPGLWQHCQERFTQHKFFAAGVAGACAFRVGLRGEHQRIPLRIEPRGIIEPFEWLLHRIRV
ncbi:MAG: TRAFAC clade GTPase domain-containing protein [Pirellulales bacterium]